MRQTTFEHAIAGTGLLAAALGLCACGVANDSVGNGKDGVASRDAQGPYFAGPALWDDPQNAPHPAFNWPTLSHPPAGGALPPYWDPIPARALPAPIAGLQHVARTPDIVRAGGISAFGSLVFAPGFTVPEDGTSNPSTLVDIRDPARPTIVGRFDPDTSFAKHGLLPGQEHRGSAIVAYPSGRLVAVASTDTIIDVIDISDPAHPQQLPPLFPSSGKSHKVGVVPGTPIVYNAASRGGGSSMAPGNGLAEPIGYTEIFDLSDPEHPVHVQDFRNGYSCHHVFFWNRPEQNKFRAICAGVEFTQIWDTADPRNPKVIVSLPVHHGVPGTPSAGIKGEVFSHSAGLNAAGTVLYVGDEPGGGGLPTSCGASLSTPAGDPNTPVGAVWFYDVAVETAPVLKGWYSVQFDPAYAYPTQDYMGACTVHHGRLVPDPNGRDLLAMSVYSAGVVLIDFTNPTLPHAVDRWTDRSYTWETLYYNGYLLSGDMNRGLDVLAFR